MMEGPFVSILFAIGSIPLVVVSLLAYPYIALRLRDSREEHRDPELGIKTAYYLFFSVALMLIIYGLSISTIDIMDGKFTGDEKKKQEEARQKQPGLPPPQKKEDGINTQQRVFAGGRLAMSGFVVMVAVTTLIVLSLQKEDAGGKSPMFILQLYEALTAVLVVWTPVFIIHMILMRIYASQPYYVEHSHGRSSAPLPHEGLDDH